MQLSASPCIALSRIAGWSVILIIPEIDVFTVYELIRWAHPSSTGCNNRDSRIIWFCKHLLYKQKHDNTNSGQWKCEVSACLWNRLTDIFHSCVTRLQDSLGQTTAQITWVFIAKTCQKKLFEAHCIIYTLSLLWRRSRMLTMHSTSDHLYADGCRMKSALHLECMVHSL